MTKHQSKKQESKPIILASGSARRKDLLIQDGYTLNLVNSMPELKWPNHIPINEALKQVVMSKIPLRSELEKHDNLLKNEDFNSAPILVGDTAVYSPVHNKIYGKPTCQENAQEMLLELAGTEHSVLSGIYLTLGLKSSFVDGVYSDIKNEFYTQVETKVKFRPFKAEDIQDYLQGDHYMDKAGSYAIQGEGAFLVESVQGSYTNIIGLPLTALHHLYTNFRK